MVSDLFDLDLLDDEEPFEINHQVAHLFKHPYLGVDDIADVWISDRSSIQPSPLRTG